MSHTVAQAVVVYSEWIVPVCGAQVFHIRKRAHCRERQYVTRFTYYYCCCRHYHYIIIIIILRYSWYTIPTYYCYDDAFDKYPLIRRSTGWSDRINRCIKTWLRKIEWYINLHPPPSLPATWKAKHRIIQIDAMNELHLAVHILYLRPAAMPLLLITIVRRLKFIEAVFKFYGNGYCICAASAIQVARQLLLHVWGRGRRHYR